MAVRADTYAFARQAPYLLELGASDQVLTAPIRHGSTGALQAPASGTITIERPSGTEMVSAAAVDVATVTDTAIYSLASIAATEPLGSGYTVIWALVLADGLTYTWRQSAYLVTYVPGNVIHAGDLYIVIPELRYRIPKAQDTNGTDEGWQPQIDMAYWDLVRHLTKKGMRPWKVREITGYREWLLYRSLMHCVGTISYAPDSEWAQHRKESKAEWRAAQGEMFLNYDDEPDTEYRAGEPATRLAPTGRPSW